MIAPFVKCFKISSGWYLERFSKNICFEEKSHLNKLGGSV